MANFNFNKATIAGRLTADPELKQTASGLSACTFTVAVNRKYSKDGKQEADFINCQAWRQTAEFICKYFTKGASICVTGAIQTRSWDDSNGQKRYATEIVVDEAYFVDGKNDNATESKNEPAVSVPNPSQWGNGSYTPSAYTQPGFNASTPQFEEIPNDSDLPF